MPTSIVQFDNVRKHYQMGLVTVEALREADFRKTAVSVLPRGSRDTFPFSATLCAP